MKALPVNKDIFRFPRPFKNYGERLYDDITLYVVLEEPIQALETNRDPDGKADSSEYLGQLQVYQSHSRGLPAQGTFVTLVHHWCLKHRQIKNLTTLSYVHIGEVTIPIL